MLLFPVGVDKRLAANTGAILCTPPCLKVWFGPTLSFWASHSCKDFLSKRERARTFYQTYCYLLPAAKLASFSCLSHCLIFTCHHTEKNECLAIVMSKQQHLYVHTHLSLVLSSCRQFVIVNVLNSPSSIGFGEKYKFIYCYSASYGFRKLQFLCLINQLWLCLLDNNRQ